MTYDKFAAMQYRSDKVPQLPDGQYLMLIQSGDADNLIIFKAKLDQIKIGLDYITCNLFPVYDSKEPYSGGFKLQALVVKNGLYYITNFDEQLEFWNW